MKLYEYQGKKLFKKYGIECPRGVLLTDVVSKTAIAGPVVLKSQVLAGNRKQKGGIQIVSRPSGIASGLEGLLGKEIYGEGVKKVLLEEKINPVAEYYVSLSYSTESRGPVLALSPHGGTGIAKAKTYPIDFFLGMSDFFLRSALKTAGFPKGDSAELIPLIQNLWELFIKEYAIVIEINPLFKTHEGKYIAGDAKVILDDEKLKYPKSVIHMNGDIAILASGGGASLLNMDGLLNYGGRPANYTEYSGNPPADVVKDLTKQVLNKKGLKGCWVVGGIANFTDIYETMRGFIEGLQEIKPKPSYPIVVRRDGPHSKEAFAMLKKVAREKNFDIHLFGSEISMLESAKIIVELAYNKRRYVDLN